MSYEDLRGQTFNMLTVIDEATPYISPKGRRVRRWLCQCECGEQSIVRGEYLRSGNTKSCGCLLRIAQQSFGERSRKKNRYVVEGDYVVGYTDQNEPFIIDADDFEKVEPYCWHNSKGYMWTNYYAGNQRMALHRLVSSANDDEVVDHINHCTWDDRKCNLRVGTQRGNQRNKRLHKNSTTGSTGVYWDKKRQSWRAHITEDGRYHNLGRFDSFEDAVAARKAAEEKYFGEYSYDNSIAAVPRIVI